MASELYTGLLNRFFLTSAKLSKTSTGAHVRQSSDSGVPLLTQTRPKLKTNGHFTPYMQARQENVAFQRECSPLGDDDFCSEGESRVNIT